MYALTCDGAYRPSTGVGGWAFVLDNGEAVVAQQGHREDSGATNQRMEMSAALSGLRRASELGVRTIWVDSDSEYLVRTMRGEYRRRANLDIWEALDTAVAYFDDVFWNWIPRNSTTYHDQCDRLAKTMTED